MPYKTFVSFRCISDPYYIFINIYLVNLGSGSSGKGITMDDDDKCRRRLMCPVSPNYLILITAFFLGKAIRNQSQNELSHILLIFPRKE